MTENKTLPSELAWTRWTLLEAMMRTLSAVIQKVVGVVSLTLSHTAYAAAVVGVVQTILGLGQCMNKSLPLIAPQRQMVGAVTFGIFAYVSTVLGFMSFMLGADLGARVFIVTLSIIPGSIIGRIFFGKKLSVLQVAGMLIGIYAGYVILDSPEVTGTEGSMPLWVWLAVGNAVTVGLNQGVTQWVKDINPFVKNFWGGIVAILLGLATILLFGDGTGQIIEYERVWSLTGISAVVGIIVVIMWIANLFAYKDGSYIAFKMSLNSGTYLATSMVAGVLIFGEAFTLGKGAGVLLFLVSFALMNEGTWDATRSLFRARQTEH